MKFCGGWKNEKLSRFGVSNSFGRAGSGPSKLFTYPLWPTRNRTTTVGAGAIQICAVSGVRTLLSFNQVGCRHEYSNSHYDQSGCGRDRARPSNMPKNRVSSHLEGRPPCRPSCGSGQNENGLRVKIEDQPDDPKLIVTARGIGYRLLP